MTTTGYTATPSRLLMLVATLQGFALLGLYRTVESSVWPSTDPVFAVPLWLCCLVSPVLLVLSLERHHQKEVFWMTLSASAVFILLGAYMGWQMTPLDSFSAQSIITVLFITMVIVTFKSAMYLQVFAHGRQLDYATLFSNSWRNFLLMSLALLFVLAVALLLLLWSQLFVVIGIDFFQYLFRQDWFLFPVLGFSFGVGISVFRGLTQVIDNITALLQGLIRLLLPLVIVVTLMFLASILTVGFESLWDTGFGSHLVLWLTAVILFFLNAVYQDGRGDPVYSKGVHALVSAGVLTLPILSLLSFYGLSLRVFQYGLTVERIYGWLVWFILTLFALGYSWGVLKRWTDWTLTLARVNVAMGLVLVLSLLLLISPILDPRKLALDSQLARLEQGDIEPGEFDMNYVRRYLARPGYRAYERLSEEYRDEYPELVKQWARMQTYLPQFDQTPIWSRIALRPDDLEVPDGLREFIERQQISYLQGDGVLMAVDLNNDGGNEYMLIGLAGETLGPAMFFYLEDGYWKSGQMLPTNYNAWQKGSDRLALDAEPQVEPPAFFNVRLGDVVLIPQMSVYSGANRITGTVAPVPIAPVAEVPVETVSPPETDSESD